MMHDSNPRDEVLYCTGNEWDIHRQVQDEGTVAVFPSLGFFPSSTLQPFPSGNGRLAPAIPPPLLLSPSPHVSEDWAPCSTVSWN